MIQTDDHPAIRLRRMANREVVTAARNYIRSGWFPVPAPQGKKNPNTERWQELRLTEADLPVYFRNGENIGLLLGAPSKGLVDIDCDAPATLGLTGFLPPTGLIHGRTGKRSSHFWFICNPPPRPKKFMDVDGTALLELRSTGQQTIVPPSVHPSGERIEWERDEGPALVKPDVLYGAVARIAALSMMIRHWPSRGQRHDTANALAGMLLRAGWDEEEARSAIEAITKGAGDEEGYARARNVTSTAKQLRVGNAVTGIPTLAQIVGDSVVERAREWLGIFNRAEVEDSQGWSDPSPLGDELPAVRDFSLEFLPSSLRPLVEDLSERMQTPPDYAGAATVVALAGCVNRRAMIRPKAIDDSWAVTPNLWGAIVAPPGFMKSPVLHSVTRPLTKIQEFWHADYERQASDYKCIKEEEELKLQAWREQNKQAYKAGKQGPLRPDWTASAPRERRLLLTDSTFEKLHEILSENAAGVLVLRDELTGWLAGLDRQGHEGERAFYLQAWNGDAGFTVDRIGRGSIHVRAVCVSLFGNIQPARLRSYLSEVTTGGPNDDGLFQRFQIVVWPDPPRSWTYVDRQPSSHALLMAEKIFNTLADLPAEDPIRMNFDREAQQMFNKWLEELERLIRSDHGVCPSVVGHLSKYRSLMPSLAGLFELADRVSEAKDLSGHFLIDLNHVKQAVAFCNYLKSHASRVYSCVITPECRAARELARHIQAKNVRESFTPRSIYLKGWSGLDTPERVRGALSLLEDAGWVRRKETPPSPAGGRPSEDWLLNPKVFHYEK